MQSGEGEGMCGVQRWFDCKKEIFEKYTVQYEKRGEQETKETQCLIQQTKQTKIEQRK